VEPSELVVDPVELVDPPVDAVVEPEDAVEDLCAASAGSCPVISSPVISAHVPMNSDAAPTATRRRIVRARVLRACLTDSALLTVASASRSSVGAGLGMDKKVL
jgi:hypothetical protein